MVQLRAPGVIRDETALPPPVALRTGVPAFVGYADPRGPAPLTLWSQFDALYTVPADGFLRASVRAFFANGGSRCWIVPLREHDDHGDALLPPAALAEGLAVLDGLDEPDLVAAPDILRRVGGYPLDPTVVRALQTLVLLHCSGDAARFALLDAMPHDTGVQPRAQRDWFDSANGALYHPWVRTLDDGLVPPSGFVAGVAARTDARAGVHKAPANEPLDGALDLEVDVGDAEQAPLNDAGVNCLRAFPGRGIRVWGARTLSHDAQWRYVSVRRTFLTVVRWAERTLVQLAFEPIGEQLWSTIRLQLTVYLLGLQRAGALESFYVKCDAENNGADVRAAGQVVAEVGLAPSLPNEFVVVQIVQSAGVVTVNAGPA